MRVKRSAVAIRSTGGSLRNPELTARRRCVGRGSRVGREPAQPGGFLPGQAFPQAGRPPLLPGPPPRPVRALALRLSRARRSPRTSPPASGHSLRPCSPLSPSNHGSATAPWLSHPPERGEVPRGGARGCYFRCFGSPIGCCFETGTAYIAGAIFLQGRRRGLFWAGALNHMGVFCPTLQLLPFVFPFRAFKAQRRQV